MMPPARVRLPLDWELARLDPATGVLSPWMPATVPGAVQLDWAKHAGLPDYTVGRHVEAWDGLEDFAWTYRTRVDATPALRPGERLFLVVEGVDYAAEVRIEDECLGSVVGLQTALHLDVTNRVADGKTITVRVSPAPKSHARPADRTQANESCKPAVSYTWDFHPRLIPLGLWRPAYLEVRAANHFITPPELRYRLRDDFHAATGELRTRISGAANRPLRVRWRCFDPEGRAVFQREHTVEPGQTDVSVPFEIADPVLWWPHDQGQPALYRSEFELCDEQGLILDRATTRTGFRRVRLVMAPDQWKHPVDFPKSRSHPPVTLEVNGRPLFVKGTNWVCPDVFPGTVTRERYVQQLALVRASNLSLVRAWGGAAAPAEDFYHECDELGLMVWQEFPLACNAYPDDDRYLATLDRESRSLIERLRPHACVVLWCGGNELFNFWSGMTDQSLPLRLLNRNCYELDPSRPFIPTAPLEGMGHGHYVVRDPVTGAEGWSLFQKAQCTAYTEFGCPGPASAALLRRIIPAKELWPPRAGTSWEVHHAFGAWMSSSHLYVEEIEYYFGPSRSLEELVERGQLLQGLGLQGLFEEARRQKPVASLALNWCFNEPWPCAANTSLVSWPCEPKPALAKVAAACRPTLASARVEKMSWSPGEAFSLELWLLHDAPVALEPLTIRAWLEIDAQPIELTTWRTEPVAPNTNARGPRVQQTLPSFAGPMFQLHVTVAERPEWDSHYTLLAARAGRQDAPRDIVVRPGTTNF